MSTEVPVANKSADMAAYMREYRRKKNIVVRFGASDTIGKLIGVAAKLRPCTDLKVELLQNQHGNVAGLWIGVVEPQTKKGGLEVLKSMLAKGIRPWEPNIDGDRYKKKVPLK